MVAEEAGTVEAAAVAMAMADNTGEVKATIATETAAVAGAMATDSTVMEGIKTNQAATAVEATATKAVISASVVMVTAAAREAGATSRSKQMSHLCMMAIRTLFRTHTHSSSKISCLLLRAATANSRTVIRKTSTTRTESRNSLWTMKSISRCVIIQEIAGTRPICRRQCRVTSRRRARPTLAASEESRATSSTSKTARRCCMVRPRTQRRKAKATRSIQLMRKTLRSPTRTTISHRRPARLARCLPCRRRSTLESLPTRRSQNRPPWATHGSVR